MRNLILSIILVMLVFAVMAPVTVEAKAPSCDAKLIKLEASLISQIAVKESYLKYLNGFGVIGHYKMYDRDVYSLITYTNNELLKLRIDLATVQAQLKPNCKRR